MRPSWHSRRCLPGEVYRRHSHRSLMLKLLLVLVAAGVCVNISVGGFWRLSFFRQTHVPLERNIAHYARSLASEIGSPPDTAKARALADRYALRIRISGPQAVWESAPGPAIPADSGMGKGLHETEGEPGVRMGWVRHSFFVQVPAGGTVGGQASGGEAQGGISNITFATEFGPFSQGHGGSLALLICLVSLCLAAAFMVIRRLLSPLKTLTHAVERIRRGELGHQIPECGHDELGELARSFNAMSSGLKERIHLRDQLLLDVSHELRTPITRIRLALEMGPDGMAKESIRDDLREMEAMISEILETARLDSDNGKLDLEDVDLPALAAEIVADAEGRSPGAELIGVRGGQGPGGQGPGGQGPVIRIDRSRVRKVLANVIDNAMKYSSEGAKPVQVRIEADADEVRVHIEDRGVGIPESELPKIFEPFYRVDRSRSRETGGYGLGLSLCKRIMEAHGGSIAIASREGEGTEVTLAFPRTPQGSPKAPSPH